MKKIEAIIEPSKITAVRKDLAHVGAQIMSVMDVRDFSGRGPVQVFKGKRFEPPFVNETKVEVIVTDELVEKAFLVLQKMAKRDELGGEKIYVLPLDDIIGALPVRKHAVSTC